MINKSRSLSCVGICWVLSTGVFAALSSNLGVYGTIFPIEEIDLRDQIQRELESVHWASVQHEWLKRVKHQLSQPLDAGLKRAKKSRCDFIDPSIRFKTSVWHHINPLGYVKPHRALLFIDGDDPAQTGLAYRLKQDVSHPLTIVLAKGVPHRVRQYLQRHYHLVTPVYYANPAFMKRFHIEVLPSVLYANRAVASHYLTLLSLAAPYHFSWSSKEVLCTHAKRY